MTDDNEINALRDNLKIALEKLTHRSSLLNKIIHYMDVDSVGLSLLEIDPQELRLFKEEYEKESNTLNGDKNTKL